jgi:hypothetical protein
MHRSLIDTETLRLLEGAGSGGITSRGALYTLRSPYFALLQVRARLPIFVSRVDRAR